MLKMTMVLLIINTSLVSAGEYSCPDGNTYPVSLTFDDGPSSAKTNKTMDILKKKNVKGTFFVLGDNFDTEAEKKINYPILDRMKKEGHIIGSHTFHHIAHTNVSAAEAISNIKQANTLLADYMSPIIRLPYGDGSFPTKNEAKKIRNETVMKSIESTGNTHIGWDIDTNDWDAKKRPYILSTMMKQICQQKGGVILFHDIHQNTVDNLEEWINVLQATGHKIEPLSYFYKNLEAKKETLSDRKEEQRAFCILNGYKSAPSYKKLADDVEKICSKVIK